MDIALYNAIAMIVMGMTLEKWLEGGGEEWMR